MPIYSFDVQLAENTAFHFMESLYVGTSYYYPGVTYDEYYALEINEQASNLDFETQPIMTFSGVGTAFMVDFYLDDDGYPVEGGGIIYAPWTVTLTLLDAADVVDGDGDANIITTNVGDDVLRGFGGDDVLSSGVDNDSLSGGAGDDLLDGGSGFDTVDYSDAPAAVSVSLSLGGPQDTLGAGIDTLVNIENVIGSDFGDKLIGNSRQNTLSGGLGDDNLYGLTGGDVLDGGDGDDFIDGGSGDDALHGGNGDDRLLGGAHNDTLDGGDGVDFAYYTDSRASVFVDLAIAGAQDTVGRGVDTLLSIENVIGSKYGDVLRGDGGANMLSGLGGADQLFGREGDDVLAGGDGADRLEGGEGADVLNGQAGADVMLGGGGDDTYIVDEGGDGVFETLTTSASDANDAGGFDTIVSSASVDLDAANGVRFVERLILTGSAPLSGFGNALDNVMVGNDGANDLRGGAGQDKLLGGAGADRLSGGTGADTLTGGAGFDRFVFNVALGPDNIDKITDFVVVDDTILLENDIFTAFETTGLLDWGAFNYGSRAMQADDRLIYNPYNGRLLYDPDGTGATPGTLVAELPTNLSLTAGDFVII